MPGYSLLALASLATALLLPVAARADPGIDRVMVDAGYGNKVTVLQAGIGTADWKRWGLANGWSLSLYGKAGIALWRGNESQNQYVIDLSAYPVFRLQGEMTPGAVPYLEAAIGVNLLSGTRINNDRVFSTAFQFGEFVGAGVLFGAKHEYDLGLRIQHVSNGDIKEPNDGLNYGAVTFQYRFGAI